MDGTWIARSVSTIFYGGWLLWAGWHFSATQVFGTALALSFPLMLIWFPQEFNELALGTLQKNGDAHSPLPSWVLAAVGWLLFLILPLLIGATIRP